MPFKDFLRNSSFYLIFISLIFSITLLGFYIRNRSQLFMPDEYKTIKRIVSKLADRNNLGNYPITFTIISGNRVYWIAKSLGVCSEDFCYFIRNINPFIPYKGKLAEELNEAIRQSYIVNGIEAYAWPNGTVAISRSSFRSAAKRDSYLAFVIGHEISHILNNDSFENSLRTSKEGLGLKQKKKRLIGYGISREAESKADIKSAEMLINAGYLKETPLEAHDFFARLNGYGYVTENDSSHPGYEDRRKNLKKFIAKYKGKDFNDAAKTNGKWIYNRKENTLTFKIEYE
tara:strand:+ start:1989 stop:2852 length:864 start_codon:yes stop_codon:yes gene_type:complete